MKIERFMNAEDAALLSRLAEHLLRANDNRLHSAEQLIELISTAILLPEEEMRGDCVALHTQVTYRVAGAAAVQSICIVCPDEANQRTACASILAPLSLAIFGYPVGSTVEVELPFGRTQSIEILDVQPTILEVVAGMVLDAEAGAGGTMRDAPSA